MRWMRFRFSRWQAALAGPALARIARDEARHAELSLALAAALMPKLPVPQRRRVREAQDAMLTRMGQNDISGPAARQLGLMPDDTRRAAVAGLRESARV